MEAKMDTWTTHFLIRPSDSLKCKTTQWQSELKELLLQTSLWTKTEGHRTTWKTEDRLIQIKLLFLASLKQYSGIADFEELLGGLKLTVATFDKWWTIEQIQDVETVEEAEELLVPSAVEELNETGRPLVDAWISTLRERTTHKARQYS